MDIVEEKLPIGPEEVAEAAAVLQKYKAGKAALDKRLVDNELWFRMGHWKNYQNPMMEGKPQPSSGWLFNSIANKHADAMDNYPAPNVLPRAADDEQTARVLSSILPVVLEQADYEQVYSDTWWRKLKQGTGVKGVFWDPEAHGGLGEIAIRPTGVGDGTRLRQIVRFIEDSEALKAGVQGKAERLADAVVPFSFLLAGLVWLVTRNPARAASVLLVDYSCALKLSTPLAVLAAMKEGVGRGVLVKGGRFLESLAAADAVVFDKTGTLTESRPRVAEVIPGEGYERDDILRTAACLEEHFPHPVARAVVRKAEQEGLHHQEEHTEVEYVVAHGIASRLHGKRVLFGSRHYIHHDEGVPVDAMREDIERLAREGRSILYLAVDGKLAGLIAIEDPLRPEAAPVIRKLLGRGIRVVMLTGDDERTAAAVAERLGISEYRSQVLPTDKAEVIRSLQAEGHTVAMLGDGINDSPALSAADVGVTLSDGADLAREVADVVLTECRLDGLVTAVDLSKAAMRRIRTDFGLIMTLNTVFLASGLAGFLQPGPSALLHNLTTVGVSLNAMRPMLKAGAEPQLEEVSA